MKVIDKINNKEIEVETLREQKEYISCVEFANGAFISVFIVEENEDIIIYPANSVVPNKRLHKEDIETLKRLNNIKVEFYKLVEHLSSSERAYELMQENMSVHIYNPINICFEEFAAEWESFVSEYEFYMSHELAKGDNSNEHK